MAQRSMFFDAVSGDRSYDAASLAALLRALVQRDGVVYGYSGNLAVSATDPTSMNVTVATGAAFVQGRMFEVHTAGETLAIGEADPENPRIDRIVVKLDNSSAVRNVGLAVKAGTPAASPTPPTLQRDSTVWELSLAQVRVNASATSITAANITDERADATLCGNAFGFLNPTTGHKHTGAAGDGPQLTHDAIDRAKVSAFRAYQSTRQSVEATTWTKVAYQTETFDQRGEYDPSLYRFTAGKSGFYLVSAAVTYLSAPDGNRMILLVRKNGSDVARVFDSTIGGAGNATVAGATVVQLNAGDYIEAFTWTASALDTYNSDTSTYFTAVRVA